MLEGSVMALSRDADHNRDVSCSRETQVTVTTSTIGMQCGVTFLINTSSQTEEEFSVLAENNGQACALKKFPASRDNDEMVARAGLRICSCHQHSGNTGNFKEGSHDCKIFLTKMLGVWASNT
ncbi:uncharacterized protein LOC144158306 isoform X4 [Haemaphysalis longicornis]